MFLEFGVSTHLSLAGVMQRQAESRRVTGKARETVILLARAMHGAVPTNGVASETPLKDIAGAALVKTRMLCIGKTDSSGVPCQPAVMTALRVLARTAIGPSLNVIPAWTCKIQKQHLPTLQARDAWVKMTRCYQKAAWWAENPRMKPLQSNCWRV